MKKPQQILVTIFSLIILTLFAGTSWADVCVGDYSIDADYYNVQGYRLLDGQNATEILRHIANYVKDRPVNLEYNGDIVNYDDYITAEIEKTQLEKGWGPSPGNGSGAFRWNWSSPIVMSPHNPRTIFFGANHLFKTVDRGVLLARRSANLFK